jgi:hypothetical protein
MSILSDFEDRMARAVHDVFAGAFRSQVQPAELAKALGREMDDGRVVGVGRVYVPVSYKVALSEDDTSKLGDFLPVLAGELSTYLVNHAQEHAYHVTQKPVVEFSVGRGLKLGRFRVGSEMVSTKGASGSRVAAGGSGDAAAGGASPAGAASAANGGDAADIATVVVGDDAHAVVLTGSRVVVGRLKECDIRLDDQNASRRHAAFVRDGDGWAIEDLASTNGTELNGRRAVHEPLRDGDTVTVGVTKLVYHGPGAGR